MMQAYWDRIRNNGRKTPIVGQSGLNSFRIAVSQTVENPVATNIVKSTRERKTVSYTKSSNIDIVRSKRFTMEYVIPFVKVYALQHNAKHVTINTMLIDFRKYLETKTTVNVSSAMLNDLYTKSFKLNLRANYTRECGRLFMYNMYDVVPENDSKRVYYCTGQINTAKHVPVNRFVGMTAEEYAKHFRYKFTKRQIEAFRKKCIQEGTLFQWKIVKTSFKHETYYVEKKH